MSHALTGTPVPEEGEWALRVSAMLYSPGEWPMWPILPMKRRYEDVDGVQVDAGYSVTADFPLIVLKGFLTSPGVLAQIAIEDPQGMEDVVDAAGYETRVVKRYETVDELLADGWTVD